jgi:hypothetical protein
MKNKIKPAQYQPYDLLSVTGNISIDSGIDHFNIDLSEGLSGDFNITGSLKVNEFNVLSPDISNILPASSFSEGCRIVAGSENFVSGSNNCIVFGYNSVVSGIGNAVLFGDSVNLGAQNSVAIGNYISINHNGAAVFADSTNPKISYAPDSLSIEYTGGAFIRSNAYFTEDVFSNSDFTITGAISGLSLIIEDGARFLSSVTIEDSATITGNLSVTGSVLINGQTDLQTTFITGLQALTTFDIQSYSGHVASNFTTTGSFSDFTGKATSGINLLSGQVTNPKISSQAVVLTGNQNISGIKSFKAITEFCDGIKFLAQNNCDRYVPLTSTSTGQFGHVAYSGNYLYVATGTNLWGRIQISSF